MTSELHSSYQKSPATCLGATDSESSKSQPNQTHENMSSNLKTYTAGEDNGRLAELAKQFGLENQRKPRKQIRYNNRTRSSSQHATTSQSSLLYTRATRTIKRMVQDYSIEVARMRASYARERHAAAVTTNTTTNTDLHLDHVGVVLRTTIPSKSTEKLTNNYNKDDPFHLWQSDMPDWMEAIELEEEDLHAHGVGGDITSAVIGIIKGMIGPAILYLPHGMAGTGYAAAISIMLVVTFLFLVSCQCLLDSWRLEHTRLLRQVHEKEGALQDTNSNGNNQITSSRQDTIKGENEKKGEDIDVETSTESQPLLNQNSLSSEKNNQSLNSIDHHKRTFFLSYPELAYRAFGFQFEQLVKLGVTLMQNCVCLSYLIFVPQNLSTVVRVLFGLSLAPEWYLIVMIVIQVPLSWIRDIRKLSATNLLANLLILYGLIVCIVLALAQAMANNPEDEFPSSPIEVLVERFQNLEAFRKSWILFIGTSVFMFEGSITVLVPLQEAVYTEEDREKFPTVNCITILCIIAFYIFFSVICWMALGDEVHTVLTTSLPAGAPATSVQLAYSLAVIFTFPLQNYPALEIACRSVASAVDKCHSCKVYFEGKKEALRHNLISSTMVVLLAVVAVTTMDSLDKVVSLLGGMLGCPIAFMFPPLIHVKLARSAGTLSTGRMVLDILVASLGLIAMTLSTTTTLLTEK